MSKTRTKKFRGSRTCGGGTTKNRRGAGNRGGRGKSGGVKHHYVLALKGGYTRGKYGFKRPLKSINSVSIVNVGELDELADQLVEDGFAKQEDGVYHINLEDLEIEKVLGTGQVSKNMVVTAASFSATAQDKIEAAGGSCLGIDE
ncbi:large subunit ribosomal protein L15 [Methanohalophilus levihalophilus]|uniref:uL15m family ribosomal protein n=1 Tax=Methanohalophilus levihalophilus TaxID=1431282 RepID=UPI001AE9FC18|nr:uL15m family ribosomal protein [Methanohalophilus levihalophilus]MBP2029239.1 large subunit ribosomal protein L15 [Methanohalophilus levihalophilus]